jgi:hypothetical protein
MCLIPWTLQSGREQEVPQQVQGYQLEVPQNVQGYQLP